MKKYLLLVAALIVLAAVWFALRSVENNLNSPSAQKPGCPEYVNCMPGPNVNRSCVIPPGCEGYTQKAY